MVERERESEQKETEKLVKRERHRVRRSVMSAEQMTTMKGVERREGELRRPQWADFHSLFRRRAVDDSTNSDPQSA